VLRGALVSADLVGLRLAQSQKPYPEPYKEVGESGGLCRGVGLPPPLPNMAVRCGRVPVEYDYMRGTTPLPRDLQCSHTNPETLYCVVRNVLFRVTHARGAGVTDRIR
jgi:hypothetical protein